MTGIKTHILCSIMFFESAAVYEILWKNIVESSRPQMTIQRRRIACWIPKVIDTHLEYIILTAFFASCTMGTGSFRGIKRPGRGADHPPPSSAEVRKE
jgi:hypothetical protein